MNDLTQQDWYQSLISDCKAIITEAIFTSRWALVEGYWKLGKRIREDVSFQKYAKDNYSSLTGLSKKIGIGYRDIYRAIQLYEKYPALNDLPEGKNITWNKLITKYLPQPKKQLTPALPDGKYNVIYADPPWDIGSIELEKWQSPLEDKYPTMTLNELKALPVQDIASDNCVCFLWSTLTVLPQALQLLESWGFQYHVTLTWDKGSGWCSNGFHRKTELLLVGYRGILSNVIKQQGDYIPTVFFEKKTTHSTKPEIVYKYLLTRTTGKRIELFARSKREGFDVWGLEV
jgi:N6-adenosine-specific RNA methylase IME4